MQTGRLSVFVAGLSAPSKRARFQIEQHAGGCEIGDFQNAEHEFRVLRRRHRAVDLDRVALENRELRRRARQRDTLPDRKSLKNKDHTHIASGI